MGSASTRAKKHNDFDHLTMWRTPERVLPFAIRIFCSTCTTNQVLPIGTPTCDQPFAERAFRNKGWDVGGNRKRDRCPACMEVVNAERAARRASHLHVVPSAAAEPPPPAILPNKPPLIEQEKAVAQPIAEPSAAPKAEPPRAMEREDKRIVFAKLNDVYLDASYAPGWSDAKVAADLNVPRAWVTEVRKDSFGEHEFDTGEARALADKMEKTIREGNALAALLNEQVKAVIGARDDLRHRIEDMVRDLAALRKKLGL